MRETLAAADLIPGDFTIPQGYEVIAYPRKGINNLTAVTFMENNVTVTRYMDSETPCEIIRF